MREISILFILFIYVMSREKICQASQQVEEEFTHSAWDFTIKKSELSYEHQNLKSIQIARMCNQTQGDQSKSIINVVNFAFNQINAIESNTFACVAANLKILVLSHNHINYLATNAFNGLELLNVLLLDNNYLATIPSKSILSSMKSLRHLNLAENRISTLEEAEADKEGMRAGDERNLSLISLNLKGNPLRRIEANSLRHLGRLKTLQAMVNLNGLEELRFYHLDRIGKLKFLPEDLCKSSRKLASLIFRSNAIEQIPPLEHCQNLLILLADRLNGNFSSGRALNSLLDLYLGHNRIRFIDERAFVGLSSLQVLELNDNLIIHIHQNAFQASKGSLFDLNLANNKQLNSFYQLDGNLNNLLNIKLYGNEQLKVIPKFKSASNLALTYAYHCCDYHRLRAGEEVFSPNFRSNYGHEDELIENNSLFYQLVGKILYKFKNLFQISSNETTKRDEIFVGDAIKSKRFNSAKSLADGSDSPNSTSELILWPTGNGVNFSTKTHSQDLSGRRSGFAENRKRLQVRSKNSYNFNLIDEFKIELKRVRNFHSIDLESDQQRVEFSWKRGEPEVGSKSKRHSLELETETTKANERARYGNNENGAPGYGPERRLDSLEQERVRKCLPEPNAFLPCRDLFDSWWLRAGIWFVFSLAFVGNILVIIVLSSVRQSSSTSALTSIMWLTHSKRHIDVPRFLVINLAIADLLMALYLGLLAFVDLSTLGEFKLFAIKWQYSSGCKLASFLGVLSSELSVFILAIITLERNYAITNAVHLNRRLSLQKAILIMLLGYLFALTMALLPLNGVNDYRKYSICLPLDMSNYGAQLYVITLVSINTFSFLLLLSCYLRMYCAIRGSQAWNTNDLRIAKRMSILVLTDFLCWMPIILIALASVFNQNFIGPEGIKILTIFILPLNSVANPFLYAITTKKFKRDLEILNNRFRGSMLFGCVCGSKRLDQSLNVAAHKDPKVFVGYNQYKLNLDMKLHGQNRAKQASRAAIVVERPNCILDRTKERNTSSKRRLLNQNRNSLLASNRRALIENTCTCQQQQQRLLEQDIDFQRSITNPSDDFVCPNLAPVSENPKIVLEAAIEPTLNTALAPCGLVGRSRATQVVAGEFAAYLDEPAHYVLVESEELSQLQSRASTDLLRPKSDLDRSLASASMANNRSTKGTQVSNPSLANKNDARFSSRQIYLSVDPNQHQQLSSSYRSASACGYSRAKTGEFNKLLVGHGNCCSASYDVLRLASSSDSNKTRDDRAISKSINRLFSPIVKAWSSIQISLSSGALSRQSEMKQQPAAGDEQEFNRELSYNQNSTGEETSNSRQEDENLQTIDDILLMSPASRLLKTSERRMSRSCELLASAHQNYLPSSPTQSSGHEFATNSTTANSDLDDDRRILLATINRIASVNTRQANYKASALNSQASNGQYLRNRCTRCRSWSPALLSKLEDCFNQIKSKIPGLGATQGRFNNGDNRTNGNSDNRSIYGQPLEELTTTSSCQPEEDEEASGERAECPARAEEEQQLQQDRRLKFYQHPIQDKPSDHCEAEENHFSDDLDEDDFYEDGQFGWRSAEGNRSRLERFRRRFGKLHQQSSTTSDTFSTRTGGTVLTNMSGSFDSSTSIPNQLPPQE